MVELSHAWFNRARRLPVRYERSADIYGAFTFPQASLITLYQFDVAQGDTISGLATAIAKAADLLRPGDVMLLEMHMPGPRYGFQPMAGQQGYIAVEWCPHIFAAIKDATDKGILVVQAAGNGRENLDASVFEAPATGFEPTWRNPFRRDAAADSGAILVGAADPQSGRFAGSPMRNLSPRGSFCAA